VIYSLPTFSFLHHYMKTRALSSGAAPRVFSDLGFLLASQPSSSSKQLIRPSTPFSLLTIKIKYLP
jgi:hypothetical protein